LGAASLKVQRFRPRRLTGTSVRLLAEAVVLKRPDRYNLGWFPNLFRLRDLTEARTDPARHETVIDRLYRVSFTLLAIAGVVLVVFLITRTWQAAPRATATDHDQAVQPESLELLWPQI
jgi:hypothetical protein